MQLFEAGEQGCMHAERGGTSDPPSPHQVTIESIVVKQIIIQILYTLAALQQNQDSEISA